MCVALMVKTNQFQKLPKLNPGPAVNEPQVRLNACVEIKETNHFAFNGLPNQLS